MPSVARRGPHQNLVERGRIDRVRSVEKTYEEWARVDDDWAPSATNAGCYAWRVEVTPSTLLGRRGDP